MKKRLWVKIILFALCLTLLCSCQAKSPIDILSSRFNCEICWSFEGNEFRAHLSAGSRTEGQRDFIMLFNCPEELSGVSAKRISGNSGLYLGEKRLSDAPASYLYIADSLLNVVSLDYLCRAEINGDKALCYTSNGSQWYFSAKSKLPIKIESENISIDIVWIEGS